MTEKVIKDCGLTLISLNLNKMYKNKCLSFSRHSYLEKHTVKGAMMNDMRFEENNLLNFELIVWALCLVFAFVLT